MAFQILYQSDWGIIEDIDKTVKEYATGLASKVISDKDPRLKFARTLVQGVLARKAEIDSMLEKNAERWKLGRMASVDRNIMRIGAFELCYCLDIPPRVAINEAVELAKKFGSEESGAFVNGILDAILQSTDRAKDTSTQKL